ncbi:MAG TPA: tRNA 2-thiocytidine biosynthesis protein TtcA [Clostridiales bacterium]|jgi:tRNA 2-thiocytidine biosynthesis protein TtcA|nr:tRNA 2-thiocytidine biosynthesis protein TtcA [Clostridiales bacterium]
MNRLTSILRRCVDDYSMIEDGERIAVGVSGGKDSLALLCALANLRRFYPKRFELSAITIHMGMEGMDFSPVAELCEKLEVPYTLVKTQIQQVVFEDRKEKNPCSLCARMRKGVLNEKLLEQGIRKIALAHHYDDAVETFFMSLVYEGRIHCFSPVTYMDRRGVTQIRPLLYAREEHIRSIAERYKLPVIKNPCPMDGTSRRQEIKDLIKTLAKDYPDLKSKVFGAMQRLPMKGWEME